MAFHQCADALKKGIHDPQTLVLLHHHIPAGAQELPDGRAWKWSTPMHTDMAFLMQDFNLLYLSQLHTILGMVLIQVHSRCIHF